MGKRFLSGMLALILAVGMVGCKSQAGNQSFADSAESQAAKEEQEESIPVSYRGITIQWTQPQVEQAVRAALNKPQGDILGDELETIKELDLTGASLWEADDLRYLTKLETLKLSQNNIQNIASLQGLTQLKILELAENDVDDLKPLAGMKNLEHLDLAQNPISDLTPLAGLKNLRWLDCSNHGSGTIVDVLKGYSLAEKNKIAQGLVTDISPLSELERLKVLRLGGNPIHRLRPLEKLTELEELDVHCVRARDWNSILALTSLRVLDLSENDLEHINFLTAFPAMEQLDLSGNLIQSFEPLAELPALTDLHIMECGLTNYNVWDMPAPNVRLWDQLAELPALKRLWAGNFGEETARKYRNEPGMLDWTEHMAGLEELYLPFSSIQGMEDSLAEFLPALRVLDLNNSDVNSLDALRGMPALKELYCGGWHIDRPKNVSALAELPGLEKLTISWGGYGGQAADTTPLMQLTQMKELDFFTPQCRDFSFLRNMPNLEVLKINEGDMKNLEDISSLSALKSLTLENVDMNSLDGIRGCTALKELNLKSYKCETAQELAPLAACVNLEELGMINNPTEDLSPLVQLPALRKLHLKGYVDSVAAYAGFTADGIVDTASLGQLPALESLRIDSLTVPDITPLAGLPRLRELELLPQSLAEDLSALSGMTGLQKLGLRTEAALPELAALTQLRELELIGYGGNLEDLEDLKNITGLCSLTVQKCGLMSLKGIEGMTHLRRLDVQGNALMGSVSELENCSELTALDLSHNDIQKLDALADKKKLRVLCMKLESGSGPLEPLAALPYLNYLDFGYEPVKDIAVLSEFKMLRVLTLEYESEGQGFLLDPLSSCSELKSLYMAGFLGDEECTRLITGLSGCSALRYLRINSYDKKVLDGFLDLRI